MTGTVYFVQGVDGGPIKIGYTTRDVAARLEYLLVDARVGKAVKA